MHPDWVPFEGDRRSKTLGRSGMLLIDRQALLSLYDKCVTPTDSVYIMLKNENRKGRVTYEDLTVIGIDGERYKIEYMIDAGGYYLLDNVDRSFVNEFTEQPRKTRDELLKLGFTAESV